MKKVATTLLLIATCIPALSYCMQKDNESIVVSEAYYKQNKKAIEGALFHLREHCHSLEKQLNEQKEAAANLSEAIETFRPPLKQSTKDELNYQLQIANFEVKQLEQKLVDTQKLITKLNNKLAFIKQCKVSDTTSK